MVLDQKITSFGGSNPQFTESRLVREGAPIPGRILEASGQQPNCHYQNGHN
jgi:hypothetical protein